MCLLGRGPPSFCVARTAEEDEEYLGDDDTPPVTSVVSLRVIVAPAERRRAEERATPFGRGWYRQDFPTEGVVVVDICR